jgi:hypothetical protein
VVQQRRGPAAALDGSGDAYEVEADAGGQAFEQGRPVRVSSATGGVGGVQRQSDPGSEAERVGTADSPYGLPFLGEANTVTELLNLMAELAAEEGVDELALVREDEAFPAPARADLVSGARLRCLRRTYFRARQACPQRRQNSTPLAQISRPSLTRRRSRATLGTT